MAKPEERARQLIDAQLGSAGWIVQDRDEMNLGAAFHRPETLLDWLKDGSSLRARRHAAAVRRGKSFST